MAKDFNDCQKRKNFASYFGSSGGSGGAAAGLMLPAPDSTGGCEGEGAPPQSSPPPAEKVAPQVLGGAYTFSDYGKFVPLIYGSFVVTGNVFWQGPWKLHTFTRDNAPVQIYTTDFALGLCEGEIADVLRIWVGEILVFDKRIVVDGSNIPVARPDGFLAANTFNYGSAQVKGLKIPSVQNLPDLYNRQMGIQTKFSVYNGSEYQMPPDKMSALNGVDVTPGYRGTAFILFENFFTGEANAPVIRVEVLANTNAPLARKFITLPDNGYWNGFRRHLAYDKALDVVYAEMSTTGGSADDGHITVSGAKLEFINDHQWYETAGSIASSYATQFFEPLRNGTVAVAMFEGNNGRVLYGSPWAQTYLGNIEGASSGPTTHQSTGPGAIGIGSTAFQYLDDDDVLCSILALTTTVGGSNSIGFATAYDDGSLVWRDYANSVLADGDGGISQDTDNRVVPFIVDAKTAEAFPTFPDTVRTEGGHVYIFTIVSGGTWVPDVMHIDRVTFADPPPQTQAEADDPARATLANIRHTYVGAISLDLIGGAGRQHTIINCFKDPLDQCVVLAISIEQTGEDFPDRIVKYNPFTGRIIYNKPLPAGLDPNQSRGGFKGVIGIDRKWAYASPENKIVEIDLEYGDATVVVEDTDADGIGDLSAFASLSESVWLGDEGALIIPLSNTIGQPNLVKVWTNRRGSGTIPLGTIITDMLLRSGWDPSSLQIDNTVDSLSVRGYAILAEKDVRTAISELKQVFGFDVVESNGGIQYLPRGAGPAATIPYAHLKQSEQGALTETIDTDIARLRKVSLKYFDVDREYMENVQVASLPEVNIAEFSAESFIDVTVPIALNAEEAKILAEGLCYQKAVYEANYSFALPPKYQVLDPGDVIVIDEGGGSTLQMRIRDTEIGADHEVRINGVTEDSDIYLDTIDLFAAVGDFNEQIISVPRAKVFIEPLQIPAPSYLHMERIEASYDSGLTPANNARLWFFDYNPAGADIDYERTWFIKTSGSNAGTGSSKANVNPTWGFVTTPLEATGPLYSTDTRSTMTVRMVEIGDLTLSSLASEDAMIQNATFNLACVGNEIIQFKNVTDNLDGSYTFDTFLRARVGTDLAARAQRRGNKFMLITNATGSFGDSVRGQATRQVGFTASTRTYDLEARMQYIDNEKYYQQIYPLFDQENLFFKPWSPTGFTYQKVSTDLVLTWQKRERRSDAWLDDGDATLVNKDAYPAGGYTQQWELYLTTSPVTGSDAPTTYLRLVNLRDTNTFTYTAAMQTADGVDITTTTVYAFIRFTGGKTGREVGWPGKFTMFPV